MDIIQYNGQKVFTHALHQITENDLKNCTLMEGTIKGAYFFKFSHDKSLRKVSYNAKAVENKKSGLIVDVDIKSSQASLVIAGLEKITEFLNDTETSAEDLSPLKDKKTTAYLDQCIRLLGIGIDAYVDK